MHFRKVQDLNSWMSVFCLNQFLIYKKEQANNSIINSLLKQTWNLVKKFYKDFFNRYGIQWFQRTP